MYRSLSAGVIRRQRRHVLLVVVFGCVSSVSFRERSAQATAFASQSVSYSSGSGTDSFYGNPLSALGKPDSVTGENADPTAGHYFGFPNALNAFSPPYQGDEIAQVGEGGHLTLALSNYAIPSSSGPEIGIFENVGLIDIDYPNGVTDTPAGTFGEDSGLVEVSADGVNWRGLDGSSNPSLVTFDIPTTFYRSPLPNDPGAPLADFGLPFTGTLASFNGKSNYNEVLSVFGLSAGGKWIDISNTGLTQVGYVRFSVVDDGNPNTAQSVEIDAVSVANNATGSPVPEPTMSSLALVAIGATLRRRVRK